MTSLIANALNNKHTTIAGGVYFGAKMLAQLGAIWWPEHKAQWDSTMGVIEGASVGYGLVMAGDGKTSVQDSERLKRTVADAIERGDTSTLRKSDLPKP
jgi:hypothetical protein